jgi:hypothetical protein
MPKIDIDKIIAGNPKIDAKKLLKGIDAVQKLESTGVISKSTYSLETPESKRTLQYSDEHVHIRRGVTIKPR